MMLAKLLPMSQTLRTQLDDYGWMPMSPHGAYLKRMEAVKIPVYVSPANECIPSLQPLERYGAQCALF